MKKILGISLTLILVSMLFIGCGGKDDEDDTTTSAAATTSNAPTTSLTGTPPSTTPTTTAASSTPASSTPASSANDLSSLLGKAAAIANFYVEIKVTSTEGTQNMKEWIKTGNPSKFRMEISASGETIVIINDGQFFYMYDASSNTAIKLSATYAKQYSSASSDSSSITQYTPVFVRSETVNGVDCSVYQYTVQDVTTTMWIAKQNGLTIKMVSGTTTMEYSNYKFDSIPDSTFQLPAGTTVQTIPGM